MTSEETVLFAAPADFISGLPTQVAGRQIRFHEIWERSDVPDDPQLVGWVCHPGQRFVIGDEEFQRLPNLKVLVTASTGKNHVDEAACEKAGVQFLSLLDDRAGLEDIAASAEFTFLLLLETLRGLGRGTREIEARRWRHNEAAMRGHELQGRRVGLLGYGRIGRRMATYCSAFGASCRYFDPYVDSSDIPRETELASLFRFSDSLIVCCSYTPETEQLVGAQLLALLPEGATVVNTARGEVVEEHELAAFAATRPDVRIAVDVVSGEVHGVPFESPLLQNKLPNVVVMPHIAGATIESQSKAAHIAIGLIASALA